MGFLDQLVNQVKGAFFPTKLANSDLKRPANKPYSAYDAQMAKMDQMQKQLNPYINSANKNAQIVDHYVTTHPGYYGGGSPSQNYNSIMASAQGVPLNYESNLTAYAPPQQDYTQLINQLHGLVQQQQTPVTLSADMSPYLNAANMIKQQRQQNEQAVTGQAYG